MTRKPDKPVPASSRTGELDDVEFVFASLPELSPPFLYFETGKLLPPAMIDVIRDHYLSQGFKPATFNQTFDFGDEDPPTVKNWDLSLDFYQNKFSLNLSPKQEDLTGAIDQAIPDVWLENGRKFNSVILVTGIDIFNNKTPDLNNAKEIWVGAATITQIITSNN